MANPERYKVSSGDPLLVLAEITHSTLLEPIRIVQDDQDVIHGGNIFTALPFRITLPAREGGTLPTASLEVDNVSSVLGDFAEYIATSESAQLHLMQVFRSLPDVIEWEAFLTANTITIDPMVFKAQIGMDIMLDRPATMRRYDPHYFPGLFTTA